MSHMAHLAELERKHRVLDERIREEMRHPSADPVKVTELKREKLQLKDEIMRERERMVSQTIH